MTGSVLPDRPPRRARRGQRGMTLVEVMLAVAITGIVMMPLLAWAGFAMREQPEVTRRTQTASALALLQTYLPRDLAGAMGATAAPVLADLCSGTAGDGAGGGGTPALVAVARSGVRAVYSVVDGPGRRSLWRHVCASAGGSPLSSTRLLDGVDRVEATCSPRPDVASDPCGQVVLEVDLDRGRGTFSTAAARRIDGDISAAYTASGNRAPTAAIQSPTSAGFRPFTVILDGRISTDPEGEALTYAWDMGDGATASTPTVGHTYERLGTYTVTLTVTDPAGATDTTYLVVDVANRLPSVVATITPTAPISGAAVGFSASGTTDPDPGGRIAAWSWDFGDGTAPGTESTTTHTYATPGAYAVVLTVTDDDGGTSSATTLITVAAGSATTTLPAGEPAPTSIVGGVGGEPAGGGPAGGGAP